MIKIISPAYFFFPGVYSLTYDPEEPFKWGRLRVKVWPEAMKSMCPEPQQGVTNVRGVCIRIKFNRDNQSAPKVVVKSRSFELNNKKKFVAPRLTGDQEYSFFTSLKCLSGKQFHKVRCHFSP